MADDDHPSFEATGPMGTSFRARGYDAITMLLVAAVAVGGGVLYMNTMELKNIGFILAETNKQTGEFIRDSAKSQRLLACIVATNDLRRNEEFMDPSSLCHQVSR